MSLAVESFEELAGPTQSPADRLLEVLEGGLRSGTGGELDYAAKTALLELLLKQLDPARILILKPSPRLQARVDYLLQQNKEGCLSSQEEAELDCYFKLERLVRRAKIEVAQKIELRRLLIAL